MMSRSDDPDMPLPAKAKCWRCPICYAPEWTRIVLTSARQEQHATQFRACLGCSVVFIEPQLFADASSVRKIYSSEPTLAHEFSLQQQSLERRFWEARAKRMSGLTTDPPSATVETLMRRGRLEEK